MTHLGWLCRRFSFTLPPLLLPLLSTLIPHLSPLGPTFRLELVSSFWLSPISLELVQPIVQLGPQVRDTSSGW